MNGIGRNDPDSGVNANSLDECNVNSGRARVDYMLGQPDEYVEGRGLAAALCTDIVSFSNRLAGRALLKLRNAQGAVIRNNIFTVTGGLLNKELGDGFGKACSPSASQAGYAINLPESTSVTLEGNTIEATKALVCKGATSSTVGRGNVDK